MKGEGEPRTIGLTTRLLHWASALLLTCAFGLAWTVSALGPSALSARLVGIHRSVGLTVLSLTILRLTWRTAAAPLPPLPGPIPPWQRLLARGVQGALYLGLLAMPLLGWLGSSAGGDTVSVFGILALPDLVGADQDLADRIFRAHEMLGYVILGLVALHVSGAVRHHVSANDGVLVSMVTGAPRRGGPSVGHGTAARDDAG